MSGRDRVHRCRRGGGVERLEAAVRRKTPGRGRSKDEGLENATLEMQLCKTPHMLTYAHVC